MSQDRHRRRLRHRSPTHTIQWRHAGNADHNRRKTLQSTPSRMRCQAHPPCCARQVRRTAPAPAWPCYSWRIGGNRSNRDPCPSEGSGCSRRPPDGQRNTATPPCRISTHPASAPDCRFFQRCQLGQSGSRKNPSPTNFVNTRRLDPNRGASRHLQDHERFLKHFPATRVTTNQHCSFPYTPHVRLAVRRIGGLLVNLAHYTVSRASCQERSAKMPRQR